MDDPEEKVRRYQERAEEVRHIATGMSDVTAREILLNVAADYETMARQIRGIAETRRLLNDKPAG